MHDHDEVGRPIVYSAIAVVRQTADQLATYAGTYRSDELDIAYTIVAGDGCLVLQRRKFPARTLEPLDADSFISQLFQITFLRGATGTIEGFALTHPQVRRLRFVRAD